MQKQDRVDAVADEIFSEAGNLKAVTVAEARRRLAATAGPGEKAGSFSTLTPLVAAWKNRRQAEEVGEKLVMPDDVAILWEKAGERVWTELRTLVTRELLEADEKVNMEAREFNEQISENAALLDAEIEERILAEKSAAAATLALEQERHRASKLEGQVESLKNRLEKIEKEMLVVSVDAERLGDMRESLEQVKNEFQASFTRNQELTKQLNDLRVKEGVNSSLVRSEQEAHSLTRSSLDAVKSEKSELSSELGVTKTALEILQKSHDDSLAELAEFRRMVAAQELLPFPEVHKPEATQSNETPL